MALSSIFGRLCLALTFVAGLAGAASAQQRTAPPVIVIGDADLDPAKYDWLSEDGRKALQAVIDSRKAGTIGTFVFTGAPAGNFWAYRSAAKPTDPFSLSDLARQALQICEYVANASCYIVSINGKEAREANGSMPPQPRQLVRPPATFDANLIPFMGRDERIFMAGYATETKPRAMYITSSRGGVWRAGDNSGQAVASALADCQKNYPNQTCLLYAVNDRVVFNPGGPY